MKKIFLALTILLVSCSQNNIKEITYEYPKDKQIKWSDCFNQTEEKYYLYFYSETCGYCLKIKQEFLTYSILSEDVYYYVDTKVYSVFGDDPTKLIGVNDITNFYILGTPFLVLIINKKVNKYYAGMNAIKDFMK